MLGGGYRNEKDEKLIILKDTDCASITHTDIITDLSVFAVD